MRPGYFFLSTLGAAALTAESVETVVVVLTSDIFSNLLDRSKRLKPACSARRVFASVQPRRGT